MVLRANYYLNIFSLNNIINKKIYRTLSLPGDCTLVAIHRFGPCVNYYFDHNHTCGLLNISALDVQNGILAFTKFKRPECTILDCLFRDFQSQKFSRNFFFFFQSCGLLNISALHVQNGILAFTKFKRPECTILDCPFQRLSISKMFAEEHAPETP